MAINIDTLISEIESAIRSNMHDFDAMFQAVSAIFHRDLDGKDPKMQNSYIHWFMMHFSSKKYWFIRIPTSRRLKLMSAVIIGKKFRDRSKSIVKLVEAAEAVLNNDIVTFKVIFAIV
jgi:hypothetical protein